FQAAVGGAHSRAAPRAAPRALAAVAVIEGYLPVLPMEGKGQHAAEDARTSDGDGSFHVCMLSRPARCKGDTRSSPVVAVVFIPRRLPRRLAQPYSIPPARQGESGRAPANINFIISCLYAESGGNMMIPAVRVAVAGTGCAVVSKRR